MLRNKSENLIVLSDESIPIPLILSKRIGVKNQMENLNYWSLGGEKWQLHLAISGQLTQLWSVLCK